MNTTERLQALHQGAGEPSYRAIERALVLRFGDEAPTAETVRSYHQGRVKTPDRTILGMLAWFYAVDLSEISEGAARVLVLLGGGRGRVDERAGDDVPDEVEHTSRWIDASAGRAA